VTTISQPIETSLYFLAEEGSYAEPARIAGAANPPANMTHCITSVWRLLP